MFLENVLGKGIGNLSKNFEEKNKNKIQYNSYSNIQIFLKKSRYSH